MRKTSLNRREILENCIVKGLLVASVPMSTTNLFALWQSTESAAAKPTPEEVLGPFYKKGAPNTAKLRNADDEGVPLRVFGRIVNTNGDPVRDAQIDIWHADHHGRYDVKGYRFRTKLKVESAAQYEVETVMPGHYADRPAQHIHYLISAPGCKTLITQLYFATDPYFEGNPDRNYQKGSIVNSRELIRPVMLYEKPGAAHTAVSFDLCLEKA